MGNKLNEYKELIKTGNYNFDNGNKKEACKAYKEAGKILLTSANEIDDKVKQKSLRKQFDKLFALIKYIELNISTNISSTDYSKNFEDIDSILSNISN